MLLKINISISLLFIVISIITINVVFIGPASATVWTINGTDNGMQTDTYIRILLITPKQEIQSFLLVLNMV